MNYMNRTHRTCIYNQPLLIDFELLLMSAGSSYLDETFEVIVSVLLELPELLEAFLVSRSYRLEADSIFF